MLFGQKIKSMKKSVACILFILLMCFCFGCSSSSHIQQSAPNETRIHDTLSNLFTYQWYDDCCRFQDMLKTISGTKLKNKTSADYLQGYINCDSDSKHRYIYVIYSSQKELAKPVLSQQLNQSFADFFAAKSQYQEKLQDYLLKKGQLPIDSIFQKNTQELVGLSSDLFVNASQIAGGSGLTQFQNNLKRSTDYLKAAFSE